MKLLYHARGAEMAVSPFDEAILAAAGAQEVRLVCPYIGLAYLERILSQCTDWRLVTDVNEWMKSAGGRAVDGVLSFLGENAGSIRHLEGAHAKMVVGTRSAYLGSANLTQTGILARTELGVRLTDPAAIAELRIWFDGLWEDSEVLQDADLAKLRSWRERGKPLGRQFTLDLTPKVGNRGLQPVAVHAQVVDRPVTAGAQKVSPVADVHSNADATPQPPNPLTSAVIKAHVAVPEPRQTRRSASQPLGQPKPSFTTAVANMGETAAVGNVTAGPAAQAQQTPVEGDAVTLIEEFVDSHAARGFSATEVSLALYERGFDLSKTQLLLALLPYCGAHPESVFEPDTVNRLVFVNDRYQQSSRELFESHSAQFDVLLANIVDQLDFREWRALTSQFDGPDGPIEASILTRQLVRGKLLREKAGLFQLDEHAAWSPRMRLFNRAHARWDQKKFRMEVGSSAPDIVAKDVVAKDAVWGPVTYRLEDLGLYSTSLNTTKLPAKYLKKPVGPAAAGASKPAANELKSAGIPQKPKNHVMPLSDAVVDEILVQTVERIVQDSFLLEARVPADFAQLLASAVPHSAAVIAQALAAATRGKRAFLMLNKTSDGWLNSVVLPARCSRTTYPKTAQALERLSQTCPLLLQPDVQVLQADALSGSPEGKLLRALRWPRVDRALAELLTYVWENGNPLPAISVREFFENVTFKEHAARRTLELLVGLSEYAVPVSIKRTSEEDPRLLVRVRERVAKRYRPLFPLTCALLNDWVYGRRRLFDAPEDSNLKLELRPFVRTQRVTAPQAAKIAAAVWKEASKARGHLSFKSMAELEQHVGRKAVGGLDRDADYPLVVDDLVPVQFVVEIEEGRLMAKSKSKHPPRLL